MIYNSLAPNVKLPFRIVRGSVAQRNEKAANYVTKLYEDLHPKFSHGKVTINDVRESVDKVIGEKRKVRVFQNPENDQVSGGQDVLLSDFNEKISAVTLEIDSDKRYFKMADLITVIHEFQHVADMFFHPKYLSRYQYMATNDLYTKRYDKFLEEFFYKDVERGKGKAKFLKKLEYKLVKFLKRVPKGEKLNYIQDVRYELLAEMQAYKTQLKYAKKLDKRHEKVYAEDLDDVNALYLFKEKLKILKKVAKDTIRKERLNMEKRQRRFKKS